MFIYSLTDPTTGEIRYIGKTNNLAIRLKWHLGHCKTNRTHKNNWLVGLISQGLKPIMDVLATVGNENEAYIREQMWIEYGRAQGWPLTNLTDGGNGTPGYQWTAEQRAAFSAKKKGVQFSDEHKAALSEAQKERLKTQPHVRLGLKHSQAAKEKMTATKTGKAINADTGKRSADRAAEWNDPEIRARRRAGIKAAWVKRKAEKQ